MVFNLDKRVLDVESSIIESSFSPEELSVIVVEEPLFFVTSDSVVVGESLLFRILNADSLSHVKSLMSHALYFIVQTINERKSLKYYREKDPEDE
ncbi:hypothetical protein L1987_26588 [Smallanthus sonchifolius]|uniref:Uncharacterized protein n=1 Tax=Smallanthus sonchifolius TaxID=185202 RepID=A0ACB9IBC2_9ASTR|nr:hypothetical protein L1987_26588 [Smallanthus sonchifolius]